MSESTKGIELSEVMRELGEHMKVDYQYEFERLEHAMTLQIDAGVI